MPVKITPYKRRDGVTVDGWEVDIRFKWPDNTRFRNKLKSPFRSKTASQRWGEQELSRIWNEGKPAWENRKKTETTILPFSSTESTPTLAEFSQTFIDKYAIANGHKPSGIDAKKSILRYHIVPHLGHKKLNEITPEDVQNLKTIYRAGNNGFKATKEPKTINNRLTVLSKLLSMAVEWGKITSLPCKITLLRVPKNRALEFYELDKFKQLVEGAKTADPRALCVTLLGGEAGLRRGEMIALEWSDIDFLRQTISISKSDYQGHVGPTKGNRTRRLKVTRRTLEALQSIQHQGPYVLQRDDGRKTSPKKLKLWMMAAQKAAELPANGKLHMLRHTYCSHLAMAGVPITVIQAQAGHENLSTTQMYMHLSPTAVREGIELLEKLRGQ